MHQSITRNGNHFIKLENDTRYSDKWFLIEGPWFDYLELISKEQGISEVLLRPYHKMSDVPLEDECRRPEYPHPEFIWWERKEVIYYAVGKRQVQISNFDQIANLSKRMAKYPNVHFDPVMGILSKTMVFVAWQCGYGVLPAWIKNEKWDENLEELFSFTTTGEFNV